MNNTNESSSTIPVTPSNPDNSLHVEDLIMEDAQQTTAADVTAREAQQTPQETTKSVSHASSATSHDTEDSDEDDKSKSSDRPNKELDDDTAVKLKKADEEREQRMKEREEERKKEQEEIEKKWERNQKQAKELGLKVLTFRAVDQAKSRYKFQLQHTFERAESSRFREIIRAIWKSDNPRHQGWGIFRNQDFNPNEYLDLEISDYNNLIVHNEEFFSNQGGFGDLNSKVEWDLSRYLTADILLYRLICTFPDDEVCFQVVNEKGPSLWECLVVHKETSEKVVFGEDKGRGLVYFKDHKSKQEMSMRVLDDLILLVNYLLSDQCIHTYDLTIAGCEA